jgi:hypothetical protein
MRADDPVPTAEEPDSPVVDAARRLRDQADAVRAGLAAVHAALDAAEPEPPLASPGPRPEPASTVAPEPGPAGPPAAPEGRPATTVPAAHHDGARLVAIEMAVAGATRGEVGDRLRDQFGIAAPAAILDDVYGPGTPESSHMPWA